MPDLSMDAFQGRSPEDTRRLLRLEREKLLTPATGRTSGRPSAGPFTAWARRVLRRPRRRRPPGNPPHES